MPICLLRYRLNVNINFPKDDYIRTSFDGRKVVIVFNKNIGSEIFSFKRENYGYLTSGNDYDCLNIEATMSNGGKHARKIYVKNGSDLFSGGIATDVIYSIADIFVFINSVEEIYNETFTDRLNVWTRDILEKIINLYRIVTHDSTVPELNLNESVVAEIMFSTEDEIKPGIVFLRADKLIVMSDGAHEKWYEKSSLQEEKMKEIRERFNNSAFASSYENLLLLALEQARQKKYNICIVIAQSAFEIYLQELLIKLCECKQIDKIPIKRRNNIVKIQYKKAISEGNIVECLISQCFVYLTKVDLMEVDEYKNWHESTYRLRNKIIHRGVEVNFEEANAAYRAVQALVHRIENIVAIQQGNKLNK